MTERHGLAEQLIETWAEQGREGFLLSDPQTAEIGTKEVLDDACGVKFRFRWMPHREIRGDVAELERRGILNPQRDESKLFRDPRDPSGRHCFLCEQNVRECHPMERLVPIELAGEQYFAGANFAWIELDHYTVMTARHRDQGYARHELDAMLELHERTDRRFRVLFNGPGAGASIPWHLHYQITTSPMPIETMPVGGERHYPTVVYRFRAADADEAHRVMEAWLNRDPENNTVNTLITTPADETLIYFFPRDKRRAKAENKGLVGGFEVAGDFVMSAPREEAAFNAASAEIARSILTQVRPEV